MVKKHIPKNILKFIPNALKKQAKKYYSKSDWLGKERIFCISMQKTGTTSVGDFFTNFGYPTARWVHSWENQWTKKWCDGDFEAIFNSKEFQQRQVFEDDPWWCPGFHEELYRRFPNAKFILFTRDSTDWFRSMLKHANGKTLGNTKQHCKIYQREAELNELLANDPNFKPSETKLDNAMSLIGQDEHYKDIYTTRNKEVKAFFEAREQSSFISLDLYDTQKWLKLGKFIGIDVPTDYHVHSNKTKHQK